MRDVRIASQIISTLTYSIMSPINRSIRPLFKFLAAIVCVFLVISAFAAPPAGALDETHASVRAAMAVPREVTPGSLQQAAILGPATGVDASRTPVSTANPE